MQIYKVGTVGGRWYSGTGTQVKRKMYIGSTCAHSSTVIYMNVIKILERALLDFDGAEPGTTNEESENLRRRPRSPNIDIILTLVSKSE